VNATVLRVSGLSLACTVAGCPAEPARDDCAGDGAPELLVSQRNDDAPVIEDGAELDVFPPLQGGTFAELDVVMLGLSAESIQTVEIDIARREDGEALAAQRYRGEALAYLCQPDDSLPIQNMPVAFFESVVLDELDGMNASISVVALTGDDAVRFDADVVLTVTTF
jgi:hypothetical protein